jgi:hypothetical protein
MKREIISSLLVPQTVSLHSGRSPTGLRSSNYSTVKRSIELVKVMSKTGEAGERGVIDSLPLKKAKSR